MEKRHVRDGMTGGLLLIGIGVLLLTGWWWLGIMVVLGIAIGAGLVFRGRYLAGLGLCVTRHRTHSVPTCKRAYAG